MKKNISLLFLFFTSSFWFAGAATKSTSAPKMRTITFDITKHRNTKFSLRLAPRVADALTEIWNNKKFEQFQSTVICILFDILVDQEKQFNGELHKAKDEIRKTLELVQQKKLELQKALEESAKRRLLLKETRALIATRNSQLKEEWKTHTAIEREFAKEVKQNEKLQADNARLTIANAALHAQLSNVTRLQPLT